MAIATDPVIQDVLNEDFSVAPRMKAAHGSKTLTLTVTLNQRVLQPNLSLTDLAAGAPAAAELLSAAGYKQQAPGDNGGEQLPADAQAYMQNGNPPATAYQNNNYSQQHDQLSGFPPVMSTWRDPRDPRNRPIPPPDYLVQPPSSIYDSAVIAHAVLSDGKGEMTLLAVAHPGEDLRAVKKQLAERIANAVLH